ncbi:hypothetical protein [Streptomyces sp. NBC_01643]|uniref:hypothetical protein n=1 Tax=Streptomyces sp. NBC_01643 TaxID=2975906 RepID=UPI00386A14B9|nr:hypothetical protein OHB03_04365 [Streptomyces sp. NBC_01643]
MSAHLFTMCWAAQSCPTSIAAHALRADPSYGPDRYVQPTEDGGFVEFLTSTQMTLWLVAGLIAVTLLVSLLWAERRGKTVKEGDRDESG